jgi:hypothetical protein
MEIELACICSAAGLAGVAGKVEIMQACAGFWGTAQQNGDRECVYLQCGRPGVCGPATQRLCRPEGVA